MKANEIFDIKLEIDNELTIFTGRVLFWWEEQNIKIDSIYDDVETNKLVLDNSKVFIKIINKFLIKVQAKDRKMTSEDLYKKSISENKNVEWADVLHHSVVMPLYEAYIDISGSSMKQMREFRKNVLAAYDKKMRVGEFEDFPLPAELIEYDFLYTNGTITRGDLLQMSYAELLKYQAIRDIDKRYKTQNVPQNTVPQNNDILQASQQMAQKFFPDVTVS